MDNVSSSKHLYQNVPKLRFPGFEGTEYKHETVGTLFKHSSKRNADGRNKNVITNSAEHGLIPQRDFFDKDIAVEGNTQNYYIIQKGDFVYNPRKSTTAPYGPFNCYMYDNEGIVSPLYTCLTPKYKEYTEYLLWYFKSSAWYSYIYHNGAQGGARHDRVGMTNELMDGIPINLPSIQEQHKVSSFLSLLDDRIAKQRELVEKLKTYKRGVLERLLIPKPTWKKTTFGESCNDFSYGMNAAAKLFDGKHKYIRITDIDDSSHLYIQDEIVSPNSIPEEKYRVQIGDILFARTGASVGKSYIYLPSDGELYYAGFLIRVSVKKEYDCRFVYYQTLSKKYKKWVQLTSARSGQPGINAEEYKSFEFYTPDLSEQQRIADLLTKIDTYINMQAKQLGVLSCLKSALLQQMFI